VREVWPPPTDRRIPVAGTRPGVRALGDSRLGYAVLAVAAVGVFVASVVPPPAAATGPPAPRPLGVPLDKWIHAGAYGVLALLLCFATRARRTRTVVLAAVVVAAYGLAIEFVQAPLPARSFDLVDAAANATGAALAALAWRVRTALEDRRDRSRR
jgi:VanZ family protein